MNGNHLVKTSTILATIPLVIAFVGCDDERRYDDQWDTVDSSEHALIQFETCEEFESYLKLAAFRSISARISAHVDGTGWGGIEPQEDDWGGDADTDADTDTDSDADSDSDSDSDMDADSDVDSDSDSDGDSSGGSTDFGGDDGNESGTNVQELGVDEADLVKTDGYYFYSLSGEDLVIVRIGDDGELEVVSRYALGGSPRELVVFGTTVVAFAEMNQLEVQPELAYPEPPADGIGQWYDQPKLGHTRITVLDVSDRRDPRLIRRITMSANYVTSRRVGSSLRVVLVSALPALQLPVDPSSVPYSTNAAQAAQVLLEGNIERISALELSDMLPKRNDFVVGGSGNDVYPNITYCQDGMGPRKTAGTAITNILTIDLDNPSQRRSPTGIVGDTGQVYASQQALYLATSRDYVISAAATGQWNEETTGIHVFDTATDASTAIYRATGTLPGRVLNQFSMGEHREYLRVATSTGSSFSDFDNHLFVLEQDGRQLKIVGEQHGIGTGEELYAARFHGDRGYMVTWRQHDPLFVFNLTDPRDPQLVGMWEGPGFSTYLHPVGDEQLLSVGLEGGDVALSLFSVPFFGVPALVDRIYLPDHSYDSPAVNDHRGFTFSPSRELLSVPYVQGGSTGLFLYEVDEIGFGEAGSMDLGGAEGYNSPTQRSMFGGDTIYAFSRCRITSASIFAPEATLDSVALYDATGCPADPWI